jgi:hypothetical protein
MIEFVQGPGAEASVSRSEESIPVMNGHDADARAAAIRAEAEEILARTAPTPESIAEQEERRRRNRAAEIMARLAPSQEPPVVYKVNGSALIQSDDRARAMTDDRPATRGYVYRQEKVLLAALCDKFIPWILKLERELQSMKAATAPKSRTRLVFLPSRDNGIGGAHE